MAKPAPRKADRIGHVMTALCAGALALNLLLVVGLLLLLALNGLGYFWQRPLAEIELDDGSVWLAEVHEREQIPETDATRIRIKIANRELTGQDFLWIDERQVVRREEPVDAVLLERLEWGNFNGRMVEMRRGEEVLARGGDDVWRAFEELHPRKLGQLEQIQALERGEIGDVNHEMEAVRLGKRRLELDDPDPGEYRRRLGELEQREQSLASTYEALSRRLFAMRDELGAERVVMEAADGQQSEVAVGEIVRAVQANRLDFGSRVGLYSSRVWEFLFDEPRESNTEGGIFPAIFGTVMMVFVMSFAVAPLGVLAALYLREYARQGVLVRLVRIAVNNLAGVPSIVFGVFGLGFFVYLVGGNIDRLFYSEALPTATFGTGGILWASLTLALLTVPVVIVATEEGLAAVPRGIREGSLAMGATKFETTWHVVIPAAAPGIMTGMILAMARAAGEVAPLMIVGMVKLAPSLPVDSHFPFVHLERKFMHLGFHIYDVGFQSPNVESVKPLVFATALLLIGVVTVINLVAIMLRNYLRRKYATSAV